jgi:hypothetical protein
LHTVFDVFTTIFQDSHHGLGGGYWRFFRNNFNGKGRHPRIYRIVSEIVFGTSAEPSGGCFGIPPFVVEVIDRGEFADLKRIESFRHILKIAKRHNFKIMEGVDVEEVSTPIKWVEWSEVLITEAKPYGRLISFLDENV